MHNLTLWQAQLEAASTDLKKIGLSANLAQAQKELKQDPAAFVFPGPDKAGPNTLVNAVSQSVSATVSIVIAIKHAGAKTGGKNIDELNVVRQQINDALLGWQPADADDQVEYANGRLIGFNNQVLWWIDNYQTTYTRRKV